MKIHQFLLCALLSIAGTEAYAYEGNSIASDATPSQKAGFVTVSNNEYNAMESRIANLETKLASFENSELANAAQSGCTSCTGCGYTGCTSCGCTSCGCSNCSCGDHCCCQSDCCGWMNTDCGAFGEAFLFLRVHDSEAQDGGRRFETGSRYTFGYMGNCGSSLRVRYFEYSSPFDLGSGNIQLECLDTEYAARFCLGNVLRGELSAGVRWAQYDEFHDFGEGALRFKYNDTIGILVGLTLHGPTIHCWDTFLTIRHSQQYGQANNTFGPERTDSAGTFSITEIQLGLTREFCCECGGTAWVSAFAESQVWSGVQDADSEDIGLAGFGFTVGYKR